VWIDIRFNARWALTSIQSIMRRIDNEDKKVFEFDKNKWKGFNFFEGNLLKVFCNVLWEF
jgi:hypothetical protein